MICNAYIVQSCSLIVQSSVLILMGTESEDNIFNPLPNILCGVCDFNTFHDQRLLVVDSCIPESNPKQVGNNNWADYYW